MKVSKKYHVRKKGTGKGKVRRNPKSVSKLKLSTRHHNKYCLCCGKRSQYIWSKLLEQKPNERGIRIWKGHKLYPPNKFFKENYFYDNNTTSYCESCGNKLSDEAVNSCYESRGEFWGAPSSENIVTGYKCQNCGYKVDF